MVLIDPSYEDKNDYRRTLNTVMSASSFATGTIAVWYPLVQRREANEMARHLKT